MALFTAHPASVGETYFRHLRFALRFGGSMAIGAAACMLHGLLPFCCTTSGSRRVRALHTILTTHSRRAVATEPASRDATCYSDFVWSI